MMAGERYIINEIAGLLRKWGSPQEASRKLTRIADEAPNTLTHYQPQVISQMLDQSAKGNIDTALMNPANFKHIAAEMNPEDLANYYGRTLIKSELLSNFPNCDCELPNEFRVSAAYPNPFNGKVNFDFSMPAKEAVEFRIYDLTGRVVLDRLILPGFGGNYRVSWDGKTVNGQLATSGIYFYEFKIF